MYVFDITQPVILFALVVVPILLIFLGKEFKRPILPVISLVIFLALLILHVIQLVILPGEGYEELQSLLLTCLAIDFAMLLITALGYLWVDDVSAKVNQTKTIDNNLDWFWGKG